MICTVQQYLNLAQKNSYWGRQFAFQLMADLDLSATAAEVPIGTAASPSYLLFDGDGYVISNATVSQAPNAGLFGRAAFSNVRLVVNCGGAGNCGGFIGAGSSGNFLAMDNYSSNTVTYGTSNLGGFSGESSTTYVSNNLSTGDVSGNSGGADVGQSSGDVTAHYYWRGASCANAGGGGDLSDSSQGRGPLNQKKIFSRSLSSAFRSFCIRLRMSVTMACMRSAFSDSSGR